MPETLETLQVLETIERMVPQLVSSVDGLARNFMERDLPEDQIVGKVCRWFLGALHGASLFTLAIYLQHHSQHPDEIPKVLEMEQNAITHMLTLTRQEIGNFDDDLDFLTPQLLDAVEASGENWLLIWEELTHE